MEVELIDFDINTHKYNDKLIRILFRGGDGINVNAWRFRMKPSNNKYILVEHSTRACILFENDEFMNIMDHSSDPEIRCIQSWYENYLYEWEEEEDGEW